MSWILDILAAGGLAAIVYGVSLTSTPAAWVVGGVLAVAAAARWSLRNDPTKPA